MENNIQKEDLLALVKSKIYTIRGQKVMLDFDLAQMYNVETKRLNEAVRRNRKRFEGDDFMFRLTKDEIAQVALRSQNVTLEISLKSGDLEDSTRSRSQFATLNRGRGSNQFTRDFHCGLSSAVVVYSCLYSCNSHKYIFLPP